MTSRRRVLGLAWGLCIAPGCLAAKTADLKPIQLTKGGLPLGGALLDGGAAGVGLGSVALQWRETALPAFGTTVWMRAGHVDASLASAALSAAALRIQAVEAQMSLFRADSDLARLNRLGRLDDAPAELLAVLREALRIAHASGGLFDPTVQPLWRLRHESALSGRAARAEALRDARSLLGWRDVLVDEHRRSIRFARPGMALTLNGIAQGWATDAAAASLKSHGIEHALIDAGEWQALGQSPDGSPWRLGVQDPRLKERVATVLAADGRAIACSSDDKLAYDEQRREHHILDPRSGHSPTQLASVVVLAPTCTLADVLTKPMMMGSAAQALLLAKRWGVDVITIDKAGRIAPSNKALLAAARSRNQR